ncbi:prepilin peptidase [Virgibacillus phasianinus]|uniref:Prepilin peptidase n=1 Tax=Virgibacillus phasianinus TaxID=2017483 RepID=A0A220U4C9_9BACI|nr:A24 family peptidase [Virgibacillus phasianinus]ASK62967.1 prepilin peptidase [Virgibacillus phasianinus]
MEITVTVIFFIFGLVFGSFFNVVGLRLPKNIPFMNDRSSCPLCNQTLSWYELIPVLSYILQFGRCRNCQASISPIYPIVELATGLLFALSYLKVGLEFELITALLLVSMLIIIFVSDIKYMLIPNKVLLFFLPFFLVMRLIHPVDSCWNSILGASAGAGITAIIILISKGGMGGGDMKLFGVLGIVLGLSNILLVFFLSTIIGAIIGILLLAFRLVDRKQAIPFGPYIVIAALVAYFCGNSIINWYGNLFL